MQFASTSPGFIRTDLATSHETDGKVPSGSASTTHKRRFFIVGCPRSGTTLLQVILNRHPQIMIPPETKLFYYYHRMPAWMRERAVERITNDLDIELPQWVTSPATSTRTTFDLIMDRYSVKVGKSQVVWCGEKTPEHTTRFHWIRNTFPDARYIAITRDGRDVVASLMKAPWIECSHLSAAMIWRRYQRAVLALKNVAGSRVLLLKYEDLVESPANAVRQVLSHLELPSESDADRMIAVQPDTDTQSFPDRELTWKATSLQPISSHVSSRANDHLSAAEVREVEYLTRRELAAFGYPLRQVSRDGPATMMRAALQLSGTLKSVGPQCLMSEAIAIWKSLLGN